MIGQLIIVKDGDVLVVKTVDPVTASKIERSNTLQSDPKAMLRLLSGHVIEPQPLETPRRMLSADGD